MFNLNTYQRLLETKTLGANLALLDEAPSTNTWIARRLEDPEVEKTVAVAERQTAGRGRFGRSWASPPGVNLAFSLAWPAPEACGTPGLVTLAAGTALAEAVEEVADIKPALKYPNDLLLDGMKAGGILCELRENGGRSFVIIGVGLNVNTSLDQLPEELRGRATSIKLVTGEEASREAALAVFLNRLEAALETFAVEGADAVVEKYKKVCGMLGRAVSVKGAGDSVEGVAVDVDNKGALVLEVAPGVYHAVISGETSFVYKTGV